MISKAIKIHPNDNLIIAIIDLKKFDNFVSKNYGEDIFDYRYSINDAVEEYRNYMVKMGFEKYKNEKMKDMRWFLEYVRSDNIRGVKTEHKGVLSHEPRIVLREDDQEIFPMLKTDVDPNNGMVDRLIYKDLPKRLKRYQSKSFGDKMRRIPWWDPSWTIVAHLAIDGYMYIHPERYIENNEILGQHRSISVREAARLQSFPDIYDFSAGGTIARVHQFRVVGNAVPPLLGKALGEILLKMYN